VIGLNSISVALRLQSTSVLRSFSVCCERVRRSCASRSLVLARRLIGVGRQRSDDAKAADQSVRLLWARPKGRVIR
jgi:hypothetical protein